MSHEPWRSELGQYDDLLLISGQSQAHFREYDMDNDNTSQIRWKNVSSRRDFSAMISELESLDRRRRYDDITSQFDHGNSCKQAAIISIQDL